MSNEQAQSMGLGFTQEIINRYDQFGGDPTLDGIFPVFGQLYEGFETLKAINATPVDEETGKIKNEIKINSVVIGTY